MSRTCAGHFEKPYSDLRKFKVVGIKKEWCISIIVSDNANVLPCRSEVAFLAVTLKPRQHGWHYPDDIFKCIFLDENVIIPIDISLKFVPQVPINKIPALIQIMALRRPGDKPLSEPMMVNLLTHICGTRPQWINAIRHFNSFFSNIGLYTYAHTSTKQSLFLSSDLISFWIVPTLSDRGEVITVQVTSTGFNTAQNADQITKWIAL